MESQRASTKLRTLLPAGRGSEAGAGPSTADDMSRWSRAAIMRDKNARCVPCTSRAGCKPYCHRWNDICWTCASLGIAAVDCNTVRTPDEWRAICSEKYPRIYSLFAGTNRGANDQRPHSTGAEPTHHPRARSLRGSGSPADVRRYPGQPFMTATGAPGSTSVSAAYGSQNNPIEVDPAGHTEPPTANNTTLSGVPPFSAPSTVPWPNSSGGTTTLATDPWRTRDLEGYFIFQVLPHEQLGKRDMQFHTAWKSHSARNNQLSQGQVAQPSSSCSYGAADSSDTGPAQRVHEASFSSQPDAGGPSGQQR